MNKLVFTALLTAALLAGCSGRNAVSGDDLPAVSGASVQSRELTLGGFTITNSQEFAGEQTGTDLTDAIEGLLKRKYSEEFICWQNVYFDEESLRVDFTAAPESDPDMRFALGVEGEEELDLSWDDYLFTSEKSQMIDYLLAPAADKLSGASVDIGVININEKGTVDAGTFAGQAAALYVDVPDEESRDRIVADRQEILMLIWEQAPDLRKLSLYVSVAGDNSFYTMDVTYDQFSDRLVLTHGTGGKLSSEDFAIRREVAVQLAGAEYLRTDKLESSEEEAEEEYPVVTLIRSFSEIRDYCSENKGKYFFDDYHILDEAEAGEDYESEDNITGFQRVSDSFDPSFFDTHDIVIVVMHENSGSIRHEVKNVLVDRDGIMQIDIDRLIPPEQTDDEAIWHIIIETDKNVEYASSVNVDTADGELKERVFTKDELERVQKALEPVMSEYGIMSTSLSDDGKQVIAAIAEDSDKTEILDYLSVIVPDFDSRCIKFTRAEAQQPTT